MSTETLSTLAEPTLHRELLDRLAERFPDEARVEGNWCDIRNSFSVGTEYEGSNGIGKLSAKCKLKINPDGTVRITYLEAIGKDFTAQVQQHGGNSVPVKYSQHAYPCQTSDYYHGWEMYGPTVEWMKKLVSDYTGGVLKITEPTLFSRYNWHGDPKKWLGLNYGIPTWLWTELKA